MYTFFSENSKKSKNSKKSIKIDMLISTLAITPHYRNPQPQVVENYYICFFFETKNVQILMFKILLYPRSAFFELFFWGGGGEAIFNPIIKQWFLKSNTIFISIAENMI